MAIDETETGMEPDAAAEGTEVVDNPDGTATVKVAQPSDDIPEEARNLVPFFYGTEKGKKFLGETAEETIDDVHAAWESASDYRERRAVRFKLFTGNLDAKEAPFEDCANVHLPLMLKAILRLFARLYSEMFPSKDYVFTVLPSTSIDETRAEVLTLHGNWQIRKEITDFFKQNRRALMEFLNNGDVVFHSYRDIAAKRNRHEALSCEEFYMPYVWKTTAVDLSDVPYKGRILKKYKREIKELARKGTWDQDAVDRILEKTEDGDFEGGLTLTVKPESDKAEGRDSDGVVAPYEFYEHHSWLRLQGEEDERPVVITIEASTKTIVCLSVREEEDWKDRGRYDKQVAEMDQFQSDTQHHEQVQQQHMQVQQRLSMPDVPPEEAMMLQQVLSQSEIPAPPPPQWMKEGMQGPDPIRKVPIELFSHGVCIENQEGSFGLGLGYLLEEFNKAADTAASQFTDSATLSNMATMIMPENVKMEPGDTRLVPGEIHRVRGVSSEQIQNAFKVIQYPPANPQLLEVVKMSDESSTDVASTPDVYSGESGKSNETYRGIATRVGEASKQLTPLAENYLEMLTQVLKNNARLNSVFMEDSELLHVIDPQTTEMKDIEVGRAMYIDDCYISFSADTTFEPKAQKIAKADELLAMPGSMPPEAAMRTFPPSYFYEATVRALKARGSHDMVRFLGPRPPTPTTEPPVPQQAGAPGGAPGGPPPPPPGAPPAGPIPPGSGAPPQ